MEPLIHWKHWIRISQANSEANYHDTYECLYNRDSAVIGAFLSVLRLEVIVL